jgi:hypothetical protein
MSWFEPVGDTAHVLRVAERDEGVWVTARVVTQGSGFFVNWADPLEW